MLVNVCFLYSKAKKKGSSSCFDVKMGSYVVAKLRINWNFYTIGFTGYNKQGGNGFKKRRWNYSFQQSK